MSDGYPIRPLGEVMRLDIQRTPMEPATTHRLAGVLNAGQGLVAKGELDGGDTEYAAMNVLHVDQVVMRKLTAWEGPITVVPAEFDGFVVSNEFPTFTLGPELMPDWMRHVCRSPRLWAEMKNRVSGTVQRRKRLNPEQLLQIQLPIPPREVQARIIEMLDAVDDQITALDAEADALSKVESGLRRNLFNRLVVPVVPAGEKFEMRLGRQKSARQSIGDHVHPYLRAANIGVGTLDLSDLKTMNFEPREQEKYAVHPGDVLLVEGGSIGQAALWAGEVDGFVGFDKHVIRIRAREGVSTPEYALQWCHWAREDGQFAGQATGITIKALGFSRASNMSVPDLPVAQQARLTGPLAAAAEQVVATRAEASRLRQVRAALLSGLLDRTIDIESADSEV
ncbi:restriction endonuclease subunit S [Streptomyces cinnamoneus]|nr:restriction endonuclease subunit S [Streptomyces cinnamoneus]